MAQLSANRIFVLHKDQPAIPEWLVCKHFLSADNMINYYETLGGIIFINSTIVCEDCYAKILTGEWKDLSATFHVLDQKSFRKLLSTIPFLKSNKDYFD
jgi:hypothetical protein